MVKESACQCRRCRRHGSNAWVGKIHWRRQWQSTPVFLPGEFPWTEEPGRLWSIGLQRVSMTEVPWHTCTSPIRKEIIGNRKFPGGFVKEKSVWRRGWIRRFYLSSWIRRSHLPMTFHHQPTVDDLGSYPVG